MVSSATRITGDNVGFSGALAQEQPSTFSLLIPDMPRSEQTDWTLDLALPLLERAARGPVQGLTGGDDAFDAIQSTIAHDRYDLIVISTLPRRVSKWLRRDLPRRVEALGVPVEVITPGADRLRDHVTDLGGARVAG